MTRRRRWLGKKRYKYNLWLESDAGAVAKFLRDEMRKMLAEEYAIIEHSAQYKDTKEAMRFMHRVWSGEPWRTSILSDHVSFAANYALDMETQLLQLRKLTTDEALIDTIYADAVTHSHSGRGSVLNYLRGAEIELQRTGTYNKEKLAY